jgi:hypothetical protein
MNKISCFGIPKFRNVTMIVCVVIMVLNFCVSSYPQIVNGGNAMSMLLSTLHVKPVLSWLSTIAMLVILGELFWDFRKLGSWLQWAFAVWIAVIVINCLLGLFMDDEFWLSYNSVMIVFQWIAVLVQVLIAVFLIIQFSGRLKFFGWILAGTQVANMLFSILFFYVFSSGLCTSSLEFERVFFNVLSLLLILSYKLPTKSIVEEE